METPRIGALVVPSPEFRETMGTGEGAAVLLAHRRGSGKLFYARVDRSYWVPMNSVREIPIEAVAEDSLERLLTDILLFLQAEECDIEAFSGDGMELAVEAPALTREGLRMLESIWSEQVKNVDFVPRSMSRIKLLIRLGFLPEASSTGI